MGQLEASSRGQIVDTRAAIHRRAFFLGTDSLYAASQPSVTCHSMGGKMESLEIASVHPAPPGSEMYTGYVSVSNRLAIHSSASVVPVHSLSAFCHHLMQACQLTSLDIRVLLGKVSDTSFTELGQACGRLTGLLRLSMHIPMNSVTIGGLRHFVDQIHRHTALRELSLDVSGNWIRGTDYGRELSRLMYLPRLRDLDLRFGGWIRVAFDTTDTRNRCSEAVWFGASHGTWGSARTASHINRGCSHHL